MGLSKAFGIGASLLGSKMASDASSDAADASADASAAQIAFEREKYDDWKDIYGDVEQNLSDYYKNLTPDFYAVQGLEAFEKEQGAALTRVRENLAQRGISDSGVAAQAEIDFGTQGAEERARIRMQAPAAANQEKLSFLSAGLSGKPGAAMSAALGQRATAAATTADSAGRAAGSAVQSAVTTVGTALDDYFNKDDA